MSTPTPQAPTHSVGRGVSLLKPVGVEYAPETATQARLTPVGAPLYGHRYGLRMNDPVTLHSALWILALRGGTQIMTGRVVDPISH
jgi:hypothetical protein